MHLFFVPVHALVGWQAGRHTFRKFFLVGFSFVRTVAVRTDFLFLFAAVLVRRNAIGTLVDFVEQRIE